jgi:TetR/AcrR family tetracycline transcriptional repressor
MRIKSSRRRHASHRKQARSRNRNLASLDKEKITATALALLDKRGLSAFTIRALAVALGVSPMALYHHVHNKAELAALVVDASLHQHPLAIPTGNWREDLWAMARWTREMALAHPAVQEVRRTYRIYTKHILLMADRWLSLWQQSGLDLKSAVVAATTSSMAIGGLVVEESVFRELDLPDPASTAHLPNARLLLQTRYNTELMFERGVRAIIDGLHARLMLEPIVQSDSTRSAISVPRGKPAR